MPIPDTLRNGLRRWPLPAVVAWILCWLLFRGLIQAEFPMLWAVTAGSGLGVAMSLLGATWWRRLIIGLGFPASLAVSAGASLPAWLWLVPLGLLLLIYPVNAWRDAPLFPTALHALKDLPRYAPLADGASVLDAGCGAGHGLQALRLAYPQAQLNGLEWSWPLRLLSALRCPWARVRRGDIWQADWSAYQMVYLFQRPESMTRAAIKAAELREGAFMVSMDFEASHLLPTASYQAPNGKMVWIYRAPVTAA